MKIRSNNSFIVIVDESFDKSEERKLTKKEYEMLIYILKNKSSLITREKIMSNLWHKKYEKGSDRVVDIFVSRLKAKVPTLKEYLHTLKGWGYILKDEKISEKQKEEEIEPEYDVNSELLEQEIL